MTFFQKFIKTVKFFKHIGYYYIIEINFKQCKRVIQI